ncbi:MAG: glycoside hydrolase family 3 N-terminal domain-containing protein [Spirochaetota bacterium]
MFIARALSLLFLSFSLIIIRSDHRHIDYDDIDRFIAQMSVREKIDQLLIPFASYTTEAFGGFIFMGDHFNGTVFSDVKAAMSFAPPHAKPFLFVDQEGGRVDRLGRMFGTEFPAPKDIRTLPRERRIAEGRRIAAALSKAGLNALLGPALDIGTRDNLMEISGRCYGRDADEVRTTAGDIIAGLREKRGILLFAKHFPGYIARENSDADIVSNDASPDAVARCAELFFDTNIAPHIAGFMVNNIWYRNCGDAIGIFNRAIIRYARRNAPDKLIITDDLYSSSSLYSRPIRKHAYLSYISNRYIAAGLPLPDILQNDYTAITNEFPSAAFRDECRSNFCREIGLVALRAFNAGCDMLMISDYRGVHLVRAAFGDALRKDPAMLRVIDERIRRILIIKKRNGLFTPYRMYLAAPATAM